MGQGQSTADSGADTPSHDTALKTDYYELLEVERTATDDEIKKAYRRKALELHPDRNYGNVEKATALFSEVQTAYEVLADPQERAWYDSHRDVLLRGDTVGGQNGEEYSYNVKMTTAEEVLKLMLKFNGRLDYSDAPSGFYGGLSDFFQKLAKEEEIACQWEDLELWEYPPFGSKDDDYEDVIRPFYAAWTGFATRKSYAWKDQYRLSDAPERRIRRLMEKENKKLREEAIQEYNDAVRSLVAFVRKRDPRVKMNQKSEAERQKALREAAAAQAAKARAQRQAQHEELSNYVLPEWAQSRTKDEHEGAFSSESEIEEHEYDCVVCDKTFKSEAQYKAHEKSKKHIKMLKQLQREMRAEGKELNLGDNSTANHEESQNGDIHVEPSDDEEDQAWHPPVPSRAHDTPDQLRSPEGDDDEEEEQEEVTSDDAEEDSDYAPRTHIENRLAGSDSELTSQFQGTSIDEGHQLAANGTSTTAHSESKSGPKLGKAKQKRAKKAAAEASVSDGLGSTAASMSCVVCGQEFTSKNKLFDHIKEKSHAAPVTQVKGSGNGKAGKKERK